MLKKITGQKKWGARSQAGQLGTPSFTFALLTAAVLVSIMLSGSTTPGSNNIAVKHTPAIANQHTQGIAGPNVTSTPLVRHHAFTDLWE